jgi:hypothetical protein
MCPTLTAMMGTTLPVPVMHQLADAKYFGHILTVMVADLGPMLTAMQVSAAKVHTIGQIMTGHATNTTVPPRCTSSLPRPTTRRWLPCPCAPAASPDRCR